MPGIQSRGRTRNNTNKIEQVKTQNKVITTKKRSTRYQPRPSSGKLDQSTQNQIQPTDSNIAQAVTVEKAKKMGIVSNVPNNKSDEHSKLTPLGLFIQGGSNQVTDYESIVNWDRKTESILNQSLEKGFSGDWEGAYKHIQDNPYRFAGNLAVEVGSALIPATWGVKAVKYGIQASKAANKSRQMSKMKVTPHEKDLLTKKQWEISDVKHLRETKATNKAGLAELPLASLEETPFYYNIAFKTTHEVPFALGQKKISKGTALKNKKLMVNLTKDELYDNFYFTEVTHITGEKLVIPVKRGLGIGALGPLPNHKNIPLFTPGQVFRIGGKKVKHPININIKSSRVLDKDEMFKVIKPFRTEAAINDPGKYIYFKGSNIRTEKARSKLKEQKTNYEQRLEGKIGAQEMGRPNMFGLAMGKLPLAWQAERIIDIVKNKIPSKTLIKPGKTLEGSFNPKYGYQRSTRYMRKKYGHEYKVDEYGALPIEQTVGQKTLNLLHKANLISDRQSVEGLSLINTKSNVFRFAKPEETSHIKTGSMGWVDQIRQDEIVVSQAQSGFTPYQLSELLMHESGHLALASLRGFGAVDQSLASSASSGWDRILYQSTSSDQKLLRSKLNEGVTDSSQIRKTNWVGSGELTGISKNSVDPFPATHNRKVRYPGEDIEQQENLIVGHKGNEVKSSLLKIDEPRESNYWTGTTANFRDKTTIGTLILQRNKQIELQNIKMAKEAKIKEKAKRVLEVSPIFAFKGYQYDKPNQQSKNKKKKSIYKIKKQNYQLFGGYGQFL